MKKITSLLVILAMLNVTLPLRSFQETYTDSSSLENADSDYTKDSSSLELLNTSIYNSASEIISTYSYDSDKTYSDSEEARLFEVYKIIIGWDNLVSEYNISEESLTETYETIWDSISAKTGLDIKAILLSGDTMGMDFSFANDLFKAEFKAALEAELGVDLGADLGAELGDSAFDGGKITEYIFETIAIGIVEEIIKIVFEVVVEKVAFKAACMAALPGFLIGMAVHLFVEFIKLFMEYDNEDTGILVYQASNAVIDPAIKDKYVDICQVETEKVSIGILVKNIHSGISGSNSYVYNANVTAISTESEAYGYVHKNAGSAKQTAVGGVMNSTFMVYAGADTAGGIYTRNDTSFVGGDNVETEDGDTITLGVSYNSIFVCDGVVSPVAEEFFDEAPGTVDVYGIYANGDWSAIKVLENNIIAKAYAGDVYGIDVESSDFSKELTGNNIYATTSTGSAYGIKFNLDDDDSELAITISGATTSNSPETVIVSFLEDTIDDINSDDDPSNDIKVSDDTITAMISSKIEPYFGDSTNAIIIASNTGGGASSDVNDTSKSTAAAGILFTGGSFTASISNYNILVSSAGIGAYGIVFDHTGLEYTYNITSLDNLQIVVESTFGIAVGIYLDTRYYTTDEDGNEVLSDNYFEDIFVSEINNVDVTVSTYGNVYGYVLGSGFGYTDQDGGFAFYNSGTGNSENMATTFDYSTITMNVTSYGLNSSYTGDNAFGLYLTAYVATTDIDFESIEVAAAGTAYGVYLKTSILGDFGTNLIINTLGQTSFGVFLTASSMITGDLSSPISFNSIDSEYTQGYTLIGVGIEEGSYIREISSDISFDLTNISNKFVAYGVYLENSATLHKFTGTLSTTSSTGDMAYTDENFYGYLLGKELTTGESLLLYNNDTKNSEGITLTDAVSINLNYLESSDSDKNVYGIYVTGEDSDVEIDFDVQVSNGVGIAVYDGANVSLSSGSSIGGSTNIVDDATLTVSYGATISGNVTLSNSAVLYFNGDKNIDSSIYDITSSSTFEIENDTYFSSSVLNISDDATLKIVYDVDFYSSDINISDGATLLLESTANLYFNSSSSMSVDDAYIVIDLSTETELSDYVIVTASNSDTYDTILSYLSNSAITSVKLSDMFENQTYNYATYGDNTGVMTVSYSAKFTGDGSAITVTVIASGEFDYFKWELDDYGNYTLVEADYDDSCFSAYSSDNTRIVNDIYNEDIFHSFVNLSTTSSGGAIYTKTSDSDLSVGNIEGDFVGNHADTTTGSVRGGAIYNYTTTDSESGIAYSITTGIIEGDFVANYVYSEAEFTRGGAISNMSNGGSITMDLIYGDFKGNYAYTLYGTSSSQGGAIYNYANSDEGSSIYMAGIEGNFTGNYVFSTLDNASGGAIFNESDSSITIKYILGNFTGNYVSSLGATASGGAIYNYANGEDATATMSITGNFIGNYAYSKTGTATGGAIYNHSNTGATSTITLDASTDNIEFTGNYTQVGEDIISNAIYNYGASDSSSIINFLTADDYTITVNDGISGNSTHTAYQILNIDGNVAFNNVVEYETVNVNSGTLNLGSYEGTDDLYDNNSYIAVDASTASLNGVVLSVSEDATLNITTSDLIVSNSSITLSDGSSLTFDLFAGIVVESTSTFTLGEYVSINVDFTGVYEEFNYTLFEFYDETTYDTVAAYLQTNFTPTLSDDVISSLNTEISLSDIEYGDALVDAEGEYTLSINYDDVAYTISLELDFTGDIVYFKWTTDENGNAILESVDILAEVGTEDLDDILNDFDFSAYSSDNTRITTSYEDVDYSFIDLSSTEGAAIHLLATDSDLFITNVTGDFVANKAASSKGDALGGAIYNSSAGATVYYEYITGTFLANSATSTSNDAKGGAIYNTASISGASVYIADITGDFESNYAYSSTSDALGGAISNESLGGTVKIDLIAAGFESNYAYSTGGDALGGAISNESLGGTVKINNISSTFDGNYAYSTSGDALGGAIYNSATDGGEIDMVISGNYTNNYVYSASGNALGGAIYNSATDGGEIDMILNATTGNIVFTGNYLNEAGEISYNAIYNYADGNSLSVINFISSDVTSITLNDAISGGDDYIENQILNIYGVAVFNNVVEKQTINVLSGSFALGSYSGGEVAYTGNLVDSTLTVGYNAAFKVAANVDISNSNITLSDGSTLTFYLDSSLNIDSASTIVFDGDVSVTVSLNGTLGEFDYTIFNIADADLYTYVLDYLTSQYITINIGYTIADYGDNFYNVAVDGDEEDGSISISTYLAGEILYFEWKEYNAINNTILTSTGDSNYDSGVISVYSSSNNRIIGSTEANTDAINLETSFAGLQDTQEHWFAQGGAIYNESSTTSISIGDIKGDFLANSANSSSYYAEGGAIYNYADNNSIEIASFSSYFMSNSAFSTADYAQGGAIYNTANGSSITIGLLDGNFEQNYAYTLNNAYSEDDPDKDLDAKGGAIYNYVASGSDSFISMSDMIGDFTRNFVYASNTNGYGGVIYNESYSSLTIASILGDFTSNYAAVDTDGNAYGSAIYNYAGEGGSISIGAMTSNFINNYSYSKEGEALGGAIYNYAEGGSIDIILSILNGSIELTGNYVANEDGIISYNAIYNGADATGISTIYIRAGDDTTLTINDGISGDSVAIENQILSVNYMDADTTDSLCGIVEFNDLVEKQTITVYNGTLSLGSYAGTSDLLGDDTGISVIASNATLSNSTLAINSGATLSISGEIVKIESSEVTFESGATLSINTSGYLYVDSSSSFDISDISAFSVVYDGGFTLDESSSNYVSELLYFEDADLATSTYDILATLLDFDTDVDVSVDDILWGLDLEDNAISFFVDSDFYNDYLLPTISSSVYSISSIYETASLVDMENLSVDVVVSYGVDTAISLDATEEITTEISGEITFISNEIIYYAYVEDYLAGYITDEDALFAFYSETITLESENKTAIEVNNNNIILGGEIYARLITEDETDSLVAVNTTTGTLRLADSTIIASEIYDADYNFVEYGTAITNSHEEGEDTGLNLIMQGGVVVLGNIVANSPFYLTSEGASEYVDGTYSYNVSTLYLYGDLSTVNTDGSNDSEDITIETATLIVEGGTIDAGDGDINLIGGTLTLDASSLLTTTGNINITADAYGTMGIFDYDDLANFTNAISINVEGSAAMLVGEVLDISESTDLSAFISNERNYIDFTVNVDATTNATSVTVNSLSYFQDTKVSNVNEKALAIVLDEMTYTGDTAYKIAFKSGLDVVGLDSVIMNNYSNIAEVNTMLLSNLNLESVNRARRILEKSAGIQLDDEDGAITIYNEDGSTTVVDANDVSLIKYSNVAQLQSINLLGSKDSVNGIAGYDYWSVGSLANLDNILSEKTLVGVSVGGTYNKTKGDADVASSTTFLLNAYGVYANEGLEVFANIGYAHFWNKGYKSIGISADWDSDAFNALIGVSYDLETTIDGLSITPLAMLNLVYLSSDSANYSDYINVDSQSYLSAKLMLGIEAQYAITERFNSIFRVMYSHEMGDTSNDFTYGVDTLISGLSYMGSETGADAAILGFGLSYDFSETCTAYFDYNAYLYESFITHSLNLSVGIKF